MFVTFEGPEGSGKSTQIKLAHQFLTELGVPVIRTREPGGTPIGDQIRATVHHVKNTKMSPVAELLLYSASRAQLVAELIRPSLQTGKVVLCDRYADSTLAYQGYGRGLDLTMLNDITGYATQGLKPDLTLLFDIDVQAGIERRTVGGEEMNRLDLESIQFHEKVRQGYHRLAANEPKRWVVIEANRPIEAIQQEVAVVLKSNLGLL
ncbi:MAG: dTMP kinase [Chloroflexota bacterium]